MSKLNTDQENAKWLLTELCNTEGIEHDELDVRFEVDDVETGCDVKIQDIAVMHHANLNIRQRNQQLTRR